MPSDRPIKVMLVDDTDHVRRMLATMLSVDGFAVVAEEGSGEAALEAAAKADPDVVVVDYKMPGLDGLETATRLRAERPDQVVILYTAFVDPDVYAKAAAAGVALCLAKVDGLASLEQHIQRLCRE